MKNIIFSQLSIKANGFLPMLTAILLAFAVGVADAANVNRKLCFNSSATATVDGDVGGDSAWGSGEWRYGSWKYTFGNGLNQSSAVVQGTRNSTHLFFAFEVFQDKSFDAQDVIVLTLDPGSDQPRRRLHIFPVCAGVGACPDDLTTPENEAGRAFQVQVTEWNGSNWINAVINPAWIQTGVTSVDAGTQKSWAIEVSIPYAQIPVPASGLFGMYFNIIRVDSSVSPALALQMDWPPEAPDISGTTASDVGFFLDTGTPSEGVWGNGTRGGVACNGVSITSSDIKTNNSPTSLISLNDDNFFTATVHNSSVNSTGVTTGVNGVRATFRLANWGISGEDEWIEVPAANNKPVGNIAASGSTDLTTGAWGLSSAEQLKYDPPDQHQCIRVDLDQDPSVSGSVSFLNHIAFRNMDFDVTTSPVRRTARIGTKGFKMAPGYKRHRLILKEYAYNTPRNSKWKTSIDGLEPIGSAKGVYRLELDRNSARNLQTSITPPIIKIPIDMIQIKPGTGGIIPIFEKKVGSKPRVVPVRPGNILTLIASGKVNLNLGGEESIVVNPIGTTDFVLGGVLKNRAVLTQSKNRIAKNASLGAMVGSFDYFKSSFAIGASTSVRVPKGATKLFLAINDVEGGHARQTGEGYAVQVTQTAYRPEYTQVPSLIPSNGDAASIELPLGANLPSWAMCGELMTGKKISINETVLDVVRQVGCYGVMIKDNRSILGQETETGGGRESFCNLVN